MAPYDGTLAHIPSVIHDGVESVSDGEHCAVLKLCPDGHLYEVVSFQVNGGSGFIQYQDASFAEESSGQADELSLTDTGEERRIYL